MIKKIELKDKQISINKFGKFRKNYIKLHIRLNIR